MNTLTKRRVSVKFQVLAGLAAIIGAVALPQLFHAVGAVSGLGTSLGETFLPMHIPVILAGFLAGPFAGAAAGAVGPLVSFAVSGMPGLAILPFMCIELCVYGLTAGLLANAKMPSVCKLLIAMAAGRIVRAGAIALSIFAFGNETLKPAAMWNNLTVGLPGILLQLCVIPLLLYRIDGVKKNER